MKTSAPQSVERVRADFPILSTQMNGKPLAYLDNAASAQKPLSVIERMDQFYRLEYANIHRGVYRLSYEATARCEEARALCARFMNAACPEEVVFVRGATEAVNLVAGTFAEDRSAGGSGGSVVITESEHHANLVPWQALCEKKGLELRVIPVDDDGLLRMDAAERLIDSKTRIVAAGHASNVLGTVHDVKTLAKIAHAAKTFLLVDGAQAAPHLPIDVQDLECDFYCFSGHKIYGPTGVGVLYGKASLLEGMRPYQYGGDMIESVSWERTTYARPPQRFEAGTPPVVEIVGLAAALEYIGSLGFAWIEDRERELLNDASLRLSRIPGIKIYGKISQGVPRASLISFTLNDAHPHDIGTVLDQDGIAVRAGHHCAEPLMRRFGVPAMVRASFSFYNTRSEVDRLAESLERARSIFK